MPRSKGVAIRRGVVEDDGEVEYVGRVGRPGGETKREKSLRLGEERRLRREKVEHENLAIDERWVELGGKGSGKLKGDVCGRVRIGDGDEKGKWGIKGGIVEVRHYCRDRVVGESGGVGVRRGGKRREDRAGVLGVRLRGWSESVGEVRVGLGVGLAVRCLAESGVLKGWIEEDAFGFWLVLGVLGVLDGVEKVWAELDGEGKGCLKVLLRWWKGMVSLDENVVSGAGVWSGEWLALGTGWLHEAMRRRKGDEDVKEWEKYLSVVKGGLGQLEAHLRPYQMRAVAWMLSKERGRDQLDGLRGSRKKKSLIDMIGPMTGEVGGSGMACSGGLLADEMGLGKTVELLALVELGRLEMETLPSISDIASDGGGSGSDTRTSMSPIRSRDRRCIMCKKEDPPCSDSEGEDQITPAEDYEECMECRNRVHLKCAKLERARAGREFLCPDCYHSYVKKELRPSRATLVVVPGTLLDQWKFEVIKHAPHLAMHIFDGVQDSGYVPAAELARADIVLTTYDALKSDVHRTEALNIARKMRHKKKYPVVPTPLLHVNWHRVCLDEAQMVENSVSTQAQMALKLTCTYRWCITGTPAHSGVYDLQGIAQFLRWEPFSDAKTWNDILIEPARHGDPSDIERVRLAMRFIGWRTVKDDVADEIGLPPQVSQVIRVKFGAVESYYYKKLQDTLQSLLSSTGQAANANPSRLLTLYLRLRQACSHPQIARALLPALKQAKKALRMTDVLDSLLAKAKVETEDAARAYIVAGNGLCGTMLLEGGPENLAKAVSTYRESLQIAYDNKDLISIDKLQRLHIVHNLADTFKMIDKHGTHPAFESLGRTMMDSSLDDEAKSIREDYAVSVQARVVAATADLKATTKEIGKRDTVGWLAEALVVIQDDLEAVEKSKRERQGSRYRPQSVDCIERIQDSLDASSTLENDHRRSFAARFSSAQALFLIVKNEIFATETDRKALLLTMAKLPGAIERKATEYDVQVSGSCGACRYGMAGPICEHCIAEANALRPYERKLFYIPSNENDENMRKRKDRRQLRRAKRLQTMMQGQEGASGEEATDGEEPKDTKAIDEILAEVNEEDVEESQALTSGAARIRSSVEQTIRIVISMAKKTKILKPTEGLLRKMDKWITQTDATKKEYAQVLQLLRVQRDYLGSLDELSMSTLRLTYMEEGIKFEDLTEHQRLYMVAPGTLHINNTQFSLQRRQALAEFGEKRGHLMYLRTLEEKEASGNKEPDQCPVCWNSMVSKISLFTCGHTLCYTCSRSLTRSAYSPHKSAQSIKCPTCRTRVLVDEIITVVHDGEKQKEAEAKKEDEAERSKKARKDALEQLNKIRVIGSHSSKVGAIVSKIKEVALSDPTAKSVVFSEWNDALKVLSDALTENGIANALISTGRKSIVKTLNIFRDTKNVTMRVLLLPIKRAAAGLNLTEATHVFLMEPRLNTAIDDQAVSRVHRIGQKKKTYVWRFVVTGTVEEKVLQMARKKAGKVSLQDADTCNDVFELFKDHHREEAEEMVRASSSDLTGIDEEDIVGVSLMR